MKKNKGFALFGTLVFLTIATVLVHSMAINHLSTLKVRKKKLKIIQEKVEVFNKKVRNERK